MNRLSTIILFGLTCVCGAASGEEAADPNAAAQFAADGFAITLAGCELPKQCGGHPALRSEKETRETGNDNLVEERQLTFDGLEVGLVYTLAYAGKPHSNPYSHPHIVHVVVTDARWPVMHGLRVGSKRTDVERLLGSRPAAASCADYASEETQDEVTFCYADATIVSIAWSKWWDG